MARCSAKANLAAFADAPRCGAKRKRDGLPCEKPGLANGRCRIHGGLTPKGKNWHTVQWPKNGGAAADRKAARKLADLKRRAERLEARLAAMAPAERERYDEWHRRHPTGSPAARAAVRHRRRQAEEIRTMLSKPQCASPHDAEIARLGDQIDALKRRAAEIEADRSAREGVFG